MSIINDALKKVQQSIDRQRKIPSASPSAPKSDHKEKFSDVFEAIIIASFLGSILIFTTFFLFSPKQKKNKAPAVTEEKKPLDPAKEAPPSPLPPQPQAPVQKKTSESKNRVFGLTLTGIVKMDQEYVALINNKIVKEGDVLGERKILRIEKDQVKVFYKGETMILKLGEF